MLAGLINMAVQWIPGLLPKLITERPDLLVDHALAYAALVKSNVESVKRQFVRRVVAGAIALAAMLSFLVLAGVALMLWATHEVRTDAIGWLLAVPGVMLVVTVVAVMMARSDGSTAQPMKSVTDQIHLDMQAFQAAKDARS